MVFLIGFYNRVSDGVVSRTSLGLANLYFCRLATGLLVATRPLAKRFLKRKKGQETNLELVVDHIGIVEEDINNDLAVGLVKINGLVWSARSKNGDVISKKSFVIVKEINGNKLIVEKRKEKEE